MIINNFFLYFYLELLGIGSEEEQGVIELPQVSELVVTGPLQSSEPQPSYILELAEVAPSEQEPLSESLLEQPSDWEPPLTFDNDYTPLDIHNHTDLIVIQPPLQNPFPPNPNPSTSSSSRASAAARKRNRKLRRLRRHSSSHQRFKCPDCGCSFASPSTLEDHQQAHSLAEKNGGPPFPCKLCAYPSFTHEELIQHHRTRHRIRNYRCPATPTCPYRARSWSLIISHVTSLHPHLPPAQMSEICLKCPICQQQFQKKTVFTRHQRFKHPELFESADKLVTCNRCGERFLSKTLLAFHVNRKHNRSMKWVCEECGMGFEWPSRLERHRIVHTRKFKRDYVCHLCGLDYAHPQQINEHYRKVLI